MAHNEDIRYWAALPAHKVGLTGSIYEPGKNWAFAISRLIKSLRPGSIIGVPDLHWLSNPAYRSDKRRRDLVVVMDAIEARKARVRELSTGDETPKHERRMVVRAIEKIGRLRLSKDGSGKGGRPRSDYKDDELRRMLAIKDSRKFDNWPERRAAIIRSGIKPPGSTWYNNELEDRARERGLID